MLTPQQQHAIESTATRILVRAGAGTGKTEVLTRRVVHLLKKDPTLSLSQMAIVTFTNQATNELVSRLKGQLYAMWRTEDDLDQKERLRYELEGLNSAPISTLHKFCRTILDLAGPFHIREGAETFEYAPGFPVRAGVLLDSCQAVVNRWMTQQDDVRPIRDVMPLHEWSAHLLQLYRSIRSKGYPLQEVLEKSREQALFEVANIRTILLDLLNLVEQLHEEYRRRKIFQLDMDDLLEYACAALKGVPGLVARVQARFRHIFVDEFQDTSLLQARLLRYFCDNSPQSPALFVVGDRKQSIYAFRGADLKAYGKMESWIRKYGEVLPLSVNFRSRQPLVEYINNTFRVIEQDERKPEFQAEDLQPIEVSDLARRDVIQFVEVNGSKTLGALEPLVEQLNKLKQNGIAWKEMAVLFRTNRALADYAEAIYKEGIPVRVVGAGTLYQRKEIVDLYRVLNVLVRPDDPICWQEALETDYIRGRSNCLDQLITEMRPLFHRFTVSQILEELFRSKHTNIRAFYRSKGDTQALANLELMKELERVKPGNERTQLVDYVQRLSLQLMTNKEQPQAEIPQEDLDAVTLQTVHGAKGLEYRYVCLMELTRNLDARSLKPQIFYCPESGLEFSFFYFGERGIKVTTQRYDEQVKNEMNSFLEEEARVLYVALTRAKEKLFLFRNSQNVKKGNTYQNWLLQEI